MQRLAYTFALAIENLRSDKSFQTDQTEKYYELIKYFFPLTADITDAERDMVYERSLLPNVVVNHQRQCDSSNTELSQGTKPSEQTPGKSTAPSAVGNTKTRTPNDTCDNSVITVDTLNQDGDVANGVAYGTVWPVVENSENKMLNNTCDKPVITNHDGNIANEIKTQLNSSTASGQYLDFSGKSTQPNSRSNNTKRSKKSTFQAQKHWFTRLNAHTRKQRKFTPKSKKVKRAHRIMSRKIGKLQMK